MIELESSHTERLFKLFGSEVGTIDEFARILGINPKIIFRGAKVAQFQIERDSLRYFDLTGADLRELDLSYIDMTGADLSNALLPTELERLNGSIVCSFNSEASLSLIDNQIASAQSVFQRAARLHEQLFYGKVDVGDHNINETLRRLGGTLSEITKDFLALSEQNLRLESFLSQIHHVFWGMYRTELAANIPFVHGMGRGTIDLEDAISYASRRIPMDEVVSLLYSYNQPPAAGSAIYFNFLDRHLYRRGGHTPASQIHHQLELGRKYFAYSDDLLGEAKLKIMECIVLRRKVYTDTRIQWLIDLPPEDLEVLAMWFSGLVSFGLMRKRAGWRYQFRAFLDRIAAFAPTFRELDLKI